MSLFLKCVLLLSVVANIYFLYKSAFIKKGISQITDILVEIRSSGFGRRIHIGNQYKSLETLGSELNILMDKFQNTIEEKQKLELSHKQLITNISHDIRTPLTSLLGFVEVLQKNRDMGAEEQKEYLNIISSKGQFLYKMIQEFFELSRLEAGDVDIKLEKLCLTDIVSDVIAAYYEEFVSAGITPEIRIPDQPVYVWGHVESTERVLNNLISNALKYGKDGGVAGISVTEENGKVWVQVWDKGAGIPEHDLPFIFNRLYTAEASRSQKLRGTGLG
ncbi:MAG: histidine kinase, partial [Eubacterium sp.]|nr:histidine kinase [Eubacterium sp.]